MSFSRPQCKAFCGSALNLALLALCCGLVAFIIFAFVQAVNS